LATQATGRREPRKRLANSPVRFAHGATADDQNLVLWRWGPDPPHKVMVYDPTGKLPKNQLSWR